MKIEILFPEYCSLFGDMSNMGYLKQCLPHGEFFETALDGEPRFLTEPMDLVYLGPMTERGQERVIEKLMPYKERIRALIQEGRVFLFTGNAVEVLGTSIEKEDGGKIHCLGLYPLTAKRDMMHRHNSTFLGKFQGQEVMGFKSQFTMAWCADESLALFQVEKGVGLNKKCKFEGVRQKNFFGTYLLGPLLIDNPPFTRYLLQCMGVQEPKLAFEAAAQSAYDARLKDFKEKT